MISANCRPAPRPGTFWATTSPLTVVLVHTIMQPDEFLSDDRLFSGRIVLASDIDAVGTEVALTNYREWTYLPYRAYVSPEALAEAEFLPGDIVSTQENRLLFVLPWADPEGAMLIGDLPDVRYGSELLRTSSLYLRTQAAPAPTPIPVVISPPSVWETLTADDE